VDCANNVEKYKYSYHYENSSRDLIFRYDMAPHFKDIETYPHHKHLANDSVTASEEPFSGNILFEIEKIILKTPI